MKDKEKLVGGELNPDCFQERLDAVWRDKMRGGTAEESVITDCLPAVSDDDYDKRYILNGIELDPERELECVLDLVRFYSQHGGFIWKEADRLATGVMSRRYEDLPYLKLVLSTVPLTDPIGAVLAAALETWPPRIYEPTVKFVDALQNRLGLQSKRKMFGLKVEGEALFPRHGRPPEEEILCEFRRDLYFFDFEEHSHEPWFADPGLECGFFYFRRDPEKSWRFIIDRHRLGEQGWSVSRLGDDAFNSVFRNYRQTAAKHGQVIIMDSEVMLNHRFKEQRIPVVVDEILKPFKAADYAAVKQFAERNNCMDLL